jgi:heme oxygenase
MGTTLIWSLFPVVGYPPNNISGLHLQAFFLPEIIVATSRLSLTCPALHLWVSVVSLLPDAASVLESSLVISPNALCQMTYRTIPTFPIIIRRIIMQKTGKAACLTVSARSKNGLSQLMQRLRIATQPLHHELDARLRISDPQAGYADVLDHLGLFHAWLQQVLPFIHAMHDPLHAHATESNMRRLQALCLDLDLPAPAHPHFYPHSAWHQPGYRWGMQYVIEGSMLGAIALLPRIAQLAADHEIPHFFKLALIHGRTPWQAFAFALERQNLDAAGQAAAEQGACDAFAMCLKIYHPSSQGQANHAN